MRFLALVLLVLFVAGCASSKKKTPATEDLGTKQAVAMQTTQSGAEGSDIKLDAILESARVTPYPKKGALQGFLLEKLKPKSPWTHAGFRSGDIVIRIGEQEIESRDDLMALFYALGAKLTMEVEVLRKDAKGHRRNVIFELSQ